MGERLHRLLCWFGFHVWGDLFHDDRTRQVKVELPRYRVFDVKDERVYRKCGVCGKRKLELAIDNPLR